MINKFNKLNLTINHWKRWRCVRSNRIGSQIVKRMIWSELYAKFAEIKKHRYMLINKIYHW